MTLQSRLSRLVKNKPLLLGLLVVLAVGLFAAAAPAIADDSQVTPADDVDVDQNPNEIDLRFEHANGTGLAPGEPQRYQVVIEGAVDGMEGYDINLTVDDENVADIVDFDAKVGSWDNPDSGGEPFSKDNSTLVDENTLSLEVAAGNQTFDADQSEIVIADVFVKANMDAFPGQGTMTVNEWGLTTSYIKIQDLNASEYQYGSVNPGPQEVAWVDVSEDGNPARDNNGDGLLGDVRGDGSVALPDALTLFDNRLALDGMSEVAPYFDFDGQGGVGLPDALTLFDERNER
jgi:hypothetical protein